MGFCVWIAFSQRFTRRRLIAAWISAVLILATGWGFIYRERIRFSVLADRVLGGQRVVVSDVVAWEILKYPAEEKSKTVVGEVASLLSGSPYRPVVLKERELVQVWRAPAMRVGTTGRQRQTLCVELSRSSD